MSTHPRPNGARHRNVLIVGLGNAGVRIHSRAWSEANRTSTGSLELFGFDPRVLPPMNGIVELSDHDAVARLVEARPDIIVDVAVPVSAHVATVEWALGLGARTVVLEKPMARTTREVDHLFEIARLAGAELIPVEVWPYSAAFSMLQRIAARTKRAHLHFYKAKPRDRPLAPAELCEIEFPHQVIVARRLLGEVRRVELIPHSTVTNREGSYTRMGVRLSHDRGDSKLETDLDAHAERVLELADDEGHAAIVAFPTTGQDSTTIHEGPPGTAGTFVDRPLSNLFCRVLDGHALLPEQRRIHTDVLRVIDETRALLLRDAHPAGRLGRG